MTLREALYGRLFPRWEPPSALRPTTSSRSDPPLRVSWLGTAGHVVRTRTTTILIDPYVSRSSLGTLAMSRLVPDDAAIARWIPPHVDAVLCGHSHFDHLMDGPRIALLRGARIVGSESTAAFARAAGVPTDNIEVVPAKGRTLQIGDVEVEFVPSLHGRIALGRVPFVGEVHGTARTPARMWDYKMGGAFGLFLRAPDVSLYHNGSADLVDAELQGRHADALIVGLAGRKDTRDYVDRLLHVLSPHVIIPTHHDAFFAPLERGLHLLPSIDIAGFVRDVRRARPSSRVVATNYEEEISVGPRGDDASVSALSSS
mgnify:CR=1 FL=1